jgi:hypothetical protein
MEHVQIAKQPIDVEQRAPVRVTHASYDALRIRVQKSDRAHGWGRHESARGARVPTERRILLPLAVRVRGKKRMQHSHRVELRAGRKV